VDAPQLDVADIFRDFGDAYRKRHPVSRQQHAVMRAIELCRTPTLGGHLFRCDSCGAQQHVHNSCGNRHCPKCQTIPRAQWVHDRERELLPVPYFHVVATLPHTLHPLTLANPRLVYDLLFKATHRALVDTAANPEFLGAKIGAATVLHTWSSRGGLHPHTHSIVQGAGPCVEDDDRWVSAHADYFVPLEVLTATFKKSFLDALEKAYRRSEIYFPDKIRELEHPACFNDLLDETRFKDWVVYVKPPFSGPQEVLEYLGRYTHRVAISNERLVRREDEYVLFRYKDYKRGGRWRTDRVHGCEFIRRFLLHVLPYRFVRIRYCGQLANRFRKQNLAHARFLLGVPPPPSQPVKETVRERCLRLTGKDLSRCLVCDEGRLILRSSTPRPRLSELIVRPRPGKARAPLANPRVSRGPPVP